MIPPPSIFFFFFFNDTATTEIYTLSLHDALPICREGVHFTAPFIGELEGHMSQSTDTNRSEEHTSELQSPDHLVCRLLLEKKKKKKSQKKAGDAVDVLAYSLACITAVRCASAVS